MPRKSREKMNNKSLHATWSARSPLVVKASEKTALLRFTRKAHEFLTSTQQRQVRIVTALVKGEPVARIAEQVNLLPSAVSNVHRRLRTEGLSVFLRKWKVHAAKGRARKAVPPAGRKGTGWLIKWMAESKLEDEPIIDIAWLRIERRAGVVIFAVRESARPRALGSAIGSIHSLLRKLLSDPPTVTPPWNDWELFDVRFLNLLRVWRERHTSVLSRHGVEPFALPVPGIFTPTKKTKLIALSFGDGSEHSFPNWASRMMRSGRLKGSHKSSNFEGFIGTLESIVAGLKYKMGGSGMLPSFGMLYSAIVAWAQSLSHQPFQWQTTERTMQNMAVQRAKIRMYHAAFGAVFELDRRIRAIAPWKPVFPLVRSRLRTEVQVAQDPMNSDRIRIFARFLPQLVITFNTTRIDDSVKETERRFRYNLRKAMPATTFVYSNRDKRRSGDQLFESLVFGAPFGRSCPESKTWFPCVLLPRRWFGRESDMISILHASGPQKLAAGTSHRNLQSGTSQVDCFVFYAPQILVEVQEAYRRNWYGDYLYAIYSQIKAFSDYLLSEVPGGVAIEAFDIVRCNPSPYHWCTDQHAEGSQKPMSDACKKVLEESGIPEVTEEVGFAMTLAQLDADLLLLAIPREVWQRIEPLIDEWCSKLVNFVGGIYDPNRASGKGLILKAAGGSRWQDEFKDVVQESLIVFSEGLRRVSRYALENAQRLLLAGKRPRAIVIETESEVLAKWRKFLQRRFKSHFDRTRELSTVIPKKQSCDDTKGFDFHDDIGSSDDFFDLDPLNQFNADGMGHVILSE